MARNIKKVVVKIGSSVIAPGGHLDSALVSKIVKDILNAENQGVKVILVSSGATACGLTKLGYKRRPLDIHSLMAISSVGQILLMDVFNAKFKRYDRKCAQMLFTWDDFEDRTRFKNMSKIIEKLLSMKIIPVINANDAISHEEIKFGDNDRLSARVADLVGAEQLIILSDVAGLLKEDKVVAVVDKIDSEIEALVKIEDKTHTSGGMYTKLEAAEMASFSGIMTRIAYGREKNIICRILNGEALGTLFMSSPKIGKARKRWIVFSKKIKGTIFIDDGAKDALMNKGKSLLGVGITKIDGDFKKDDAVSVVDMKGIILGCGLVNYSFNELDLKKNRLEKEVIHRDNFVQATKGCCWKTSKK